ncbi:MAG TPA: MOSC domain-containing protein [Acidimicrobiales bacterium]|nr:MOSC domain-containing protein [Acidimicrobiales bacterium]
MSALAGPSVTIVSVNVALPKVLATAPNGQQIWSAIGKVPVTVPELELTRTNLSGDAQADLEVHGGPDKAVYAYPADHFPVWSEQLGRPFGPGSFGENLTTLGATETDTFIGDQWQWGEAVLEVAQPRTPCFKLTVHAGTADVGRRMRQTGWSGWYLRVVTPGTVPTSGSIAVRHHPARISVRDITRAAGSHDTDLLDRLAAFEPLAAEWRSHLADLAVSRG